MTFIGGTSQYTALSEPSLQLYVYPMETTVSSDGSCFLAADGLTNTQLFTSVNAPTDVGGVPHIGNSFSMKPKIKVSVRSALPSRTIAEWELIGTPAVRIMVGGVHAFYGVSELNLYSYLQRAAATVNSDTIAQLFVRVKGAGFPVNATGFTDYRLKYTGTIANGFGRAMIDRVSNHPSLPIFSSPMNLEPAAPFYGINMSFQDNVNMGYHLDNTPAQQPPNQWVLTMSNQGQLDAATSTFDGVVLATTLSQNKLDYAPSNLDPNLPAFSDDAGMVPNLNSVDYFWFTIDSYDHGAAMTSPDPDGNRVQDSSNWAQQSGRKSDFRVRLGGPHVGAPYANHVKNRTVLCFHCKFFPGSTEYKFDFGLAQAVEYPGSLSFQVLCDAEYDTRGVGFGPLDLTSITNSHALHPRRRHWQAHSADDLPGRKRSTSVRE